MIEKIGIIGGGQLGLMIAEEAHRQGACVYALDPAPDAPAFAECDGHIVAEYDDIDALERLGRATDVLTYEFENVPGDVLRHIEGKFAIPQGIAPLLDSQDRLREKNNARRGGLPVPKYIPLPAISSDENCTCVPEVSDASGSRPLTAEERYSELKSAVSELGMPCVLKTRRLGYDGHGQAVIRREDDIRQAAEMLRVPCILEEFVPFDWECSVIMVRDAEATIAFPIGRNIHKDGILDLCIVPAPGLGALQEGCNLPGHSGLEQRMVAACKDFMASCGYRGILAVELFVKGDDFVFNEMAPRPHNSGHYTIEGCTASQYSELCHFLLGKPLAHPELKAPTVMKNILGQDLDAAWDVIRNARNMFSGIAEGCVSNNARRDNAWNGQAVEGTFVHLYGKSESRPKRKMGHITFVPMTFEGYQEQWADKWK